MAKRATFELHLISLKEHGSFSKTRRLLTSLRTVTQKEEEEKEQQRRNVYCFTSVLVVGVIVGNVFEVVLTRFFLECFKTSLRSYVHAYVQKKMIE